MLLTPGRQHIRQLTIPGVIAPPIPQESAPTIFPHKEFQMTDIARIIMTRALAAEKARLGQLLAKKGTPDYDAEAVKDLQQHIRDMEIQLGQK